MDEPVNTIFGYTQVGRLDLAMQVLDTGKVIIDLVANHSGLQSSLVYIKIDGPLSAVVANESKFTQVISNLSENAIQFEVNRVEMPTIRRIGNVGLEFEICQGGRF